MHGESDELKNEVVMLARKYGVVTPYTAYLIIEDERRRGVPLTQQSLRELDQDRLASDNAAKFYNSNRDEAAQADQRSGGQAVANAQNLGELKSASSFGGGGGRGGGGGGYGNAGAATAQPLQRAAAATTSPSEMQGYKFTTNYAQQVRVVNGRSFYQNSNAWTDSTIQANNNLKQKQIAFGSDEYFDLLKNHPEASQWLALGDQVDLVIDDMEVSVK
jgi:Ca-activated chloride channel family protein